MATLNDASAKSLAVIISTKVVPSLADIVAGQDHLPPKWPCSFAKINPWGSKPITLINQYLILPGRCAEREFLAIATKAQLMCPPVPPWQSWWQQVSQGFLKQKQRETNSVLSTGNFVNGWDTNGRTIYVVLFVTCSANFANSII